MRVQLNQTEVVLIFFRSSALGRPRSPPIPRCLHSSYGTFSLVAKRQRECRSHDTSSRRARVEIPVEAWVYSTIDQFFLEFSPTVLSMLMIARNERMTIRSMGTSVEFIVATVRLPDVKALRMARTNGAR